MQFRAQLCESTGWGNAGKMSGVFVEGTRLYRCSEGKWTWCGILFEKVRCNDRRKKAVITRHY